MANKVERESNFTFDSKVRDLLIKHAEQYKTEINERVQSKNLNEEKFGIGIYQLLNSAIDLYRSRRIFLSEEDFFQYSQIKPKIPFEIILYVMAMDCPVFPYCLDGRTCQH